MRQVISREVAITECWLDERARASEPSMPEVAPAGWDWASVVGLGLAAVGAVALAVEYWNALGGAQR